MYDSYPSWRVPTSVESCVDDNYLFCPSVVASHNDKKKACSLTYQLHLVLRLSYLYHETLPLCFSGSRLGVGCANYCWDRK